MFTVSRYFNGVLITELAPPGRRTLSRELFSVGLLPCVEDAGMVRVVLIGYAAMLGWMGSDERGVRMRSSDCPGAFRLDEISVVDGQLTCLARQRPMPNASAEDTRLAGLYREGFVLQVGEKFGAEIGAWLPVLVELSSASADAHALIAEHMPEGRLLPHQCSMVGEVVARVLLDAVELADAVAQELDAEREPALWGLLKGGAVATCLAKWKSAIGAPPQRSSALTG